MEKPILFSYWRSSCAWRVRTTLNLKGVDYTLKTVALNTNETGEQFSEEYTAVNPMQQVPALRVDGETLIESIAILEYLEEAYPEPSLMPADLNQKAKVRAICNLIATGIQPMQNTAVLVQLDKDKELKWAQHFIKRGFTALEKLLAETAGQYCVGDEITLADCCLVPQVYNCNRFMVDLSPFPTIRRIDLTLKAHPAFSAAHPTQQPDYPSGSHANYA